MLAFATSFSGILNITITITVFTITINLIGEQGIIKLNILAKTPILVLQTLWIRKQ